MPGAPRLRHQRAHPAVLKDEIVARYLAARIADPSQRLLGRAGHAGVMEQENVDGSLEPLAMIGRWEALDHHVECLGVERRRSIRSQAALIAASRSLAMRKNSAGTPRDRSRSGWFSATSRR